MQRNKHSTTIPNDSLVEYIRSRRSNLVAGGESWQPEEKYEKLLEQYIDQVEANQPVAIPNIVRIFNGFKKKLEFLNPIFRQAMIATTGEKFNLLEKIWADKFAQIAFGQILDGEGHLKAELLPLLLTEPYAKKLADNPKLFAQLRQDPQLISQIVGGCLYLFGQDLSTYVLSSLPEQKEDYDPLSNLDEDGFLKANANASPMEKFLQGLAKKLNEKSLELLDPKKFNYSRSIFLSSRNSEYRPILDNWRDEKLEPDILPRASLWNYATTVHDSQGAKRFFVSQSRAVWHGQIQAPAPRIFIRKSKLLKLILQVTAPFASQQLWVLYPGDRYASTFKEKMVQALNSHFGANRNFFKKDSIHFVEDSKENNIATAKLESLESIARMYPNIPRHKIRVIDGNPENEQLIREAGFDFIYVDPAADKNSYMGNIHLAAELAEIPDRTLLQQPNFQKNTAENWQLFYLRECYKFEKMLNGITLELLDNPELSLVTQSILEGKDILRNVSITDIRTKQDYFNQIKIFESISDSIHKARLFQEMYETYQQVAKDKNIGGMEEVLESLVVEATQKKGINPDHVLRVLKGYLEDYQRAEDKSGGREVQRFLQFSPSLAPARRASAYARSPLASPTTQFKRNVRRASADFVKPQSPVFSFALPSKYSKGAAEALPEDWKLEDKDDAVEVKIEPKVSSPQQIAKAIFDLEMEIKNVDDAIRKVKEAKGEKTDAEIGEENKQIFNFYANLFLQRKMDYPAIEIVYARIKVNDSSERMRDKYSFGVSQEEHDFRIDQVDVIYTELQLVRERIKKACRDEVRNPFDLNIKLKVELNRSQERLLSAALISFAVLDPSVLADVNRIELREHDRNVAQLKQNRELRIPSNTYYSMARTEKRAEDTIATSEKRLGKTLALGFRPR